MYLFELFTTIKMPHVQIIVVGVDGFGENQKIHKNNHNIMDLANSADVEATTDTYNKKCKLVIFCHSRYVKSVYVSQ